MQIKRILTPGQVRLLNRYPKTFLNEVRVAAGDRNGGGKMQVPNSTDVARGYGAPSSIELQQIQVATQSLLNVIIEKGI